MATSGLDQRLSRELTSMLRTEEVTREILPSANLLLLKVFDGVSSTYWVSAHITACLRIQFVSHGITNVLKNNLWICDLLCGRNSSSFETLAF